MTVYVALLRGVNVGGRGKVDMRELKKQVEALGCTDVSTYINSGNVIFRDRRAASTLTRALREGARPACRGAVARADPGALQADPGRLRQRQGAEDRHRLRARRVARSRCGTRSAKDLKPREGPEWDVEVTARNVNTVRKLREKMEAL